jgi:surface polysaccharide O-acyltransferase-like enzyme
LFALSGAIYLFALLLEAYCKPLFGFENNVWRMRNGPFFGLLFMVVGHYLAVRRPAYPLWFGAALFIGGGLLQATEALTLLADDKTVSLDVLFGTVPFGVGAFMLALKIPEGSVTRCLAFLGRYALGIYAAHVLGLWIIQPFLLPGAFWATMLAALFALVFAVLVSVLLGRFKATRLLVA